jgi:two-component system NtrC family sensor kinase
MLAVGSVARGVASEMSPPVEAIRASADRVEDAGRDILRVLGAYRGALAAIGPAADSVRARVLEIEASADIAALEENLLAAIGSVREGTRRVAIIVRALNGIDDVNPSRRAVVDVNQCLESALLVLHNGIRDVADVELDVVALPPIAGVPAALHQVFSNLVLDSLHALADHRRTTGRLGHLFVRARPCRGGVEVLVADTGRALPDNERPRVFDLSIMLAEGGRGALQGLAFAADVVQRMHGGTLEFVSLAGYASTIRVYLPGLE